MMFIIIRVVNITLQIFSILLHGFGLYLLHILFLNDQADVQHLYIAHLSITEMLSLLCLFVWGVLAFLQSYTTNNTQVIVHYIDIVLTLLLYPIMYCNMIFIVVDKVLEIYWNILYHQYWNMRRAKILEWCTFGISFLVCSCIITSYNTINNFDYKEIPKVYLRPIGDVVFLCTATVSYTYIFYKYKLSQNGTTTDIQSSNISLFTTFRNSRFFISACLVITYIVFTILPNCMTVVTTLLKFQGKNQHIMLPLLGTLYSLSLVSDACVYVLLDRKVQRIWLKLLRTLRHRVRLSDDSEERI